MFSKEFIFQVFALLISVIIVHSAYVAVIRPKASADMRMERERIEAGTDEEAVRSIPVLIKDYEQESCFILLFWAVAIMTYKFRLAAAEHGMLSEDLLNVGEGMRILPEDTLDLSRKVQSLPKGQQEMLVPRILVAGLGRFRATRNVQDVSTTVRGLCEGEAERLDSELAMVRYIAWAIPSIGFIGTVRGIGQALGRAHMAVEGDITEVTQSLGVAFNSTLIALFISIVLMFIVHQLQLMQERYVMDAERYGDERLVSNLHAEN